MADEAGGKLYRALGSFTLVATIGIVGYGLYIQHIYTKIDAALVAGLLVAGMALLRPQWVDSTIKTVADKIPFMAYKKPDA